MAKRKRKLTPAEKRAKKKRRLETKIIFINGKKKRVKREPTIDGMSVDEFIRRNADPIWLHQNEMWHLIDPPPDLPVAPDLPTSPGPSNRPNQSSYCPSSPTDEIPF